MSDQLIIAGFHRSGTSATSRLLHRAGLFLGYELLEALPSNPYGHFEDREIVNLHTRILSDNEKTWAVDETFLPIVVQQRWQLMQSIIDRRNSEHRLWGFKDPRACLFMMLWKHLLPNAKVLIVYRHFSGSTYSLGQRHSSDMFLGRGSELVHRRFWEEPDSRVADVARAQQRAARVRPRLPRGHHDRLAGHDQGRVPDRLGPEPEVGIGPRRRARRRGVRPEHKPAPHPQAAGLRPRADREVFSETWRRLEELAGETEMLLGKEAPVV